jgi:hypothetical protein
MESFKNASPKLANFLKKKKSKIDKCGEMEKALGVPTPKTPAMPSSTGTTPNAPASAPKPTVAAKPMGLPKQTMPKV